MLVGLVFLFNPETVRNISMTTLKTIKIPMCSPEVQSWLDQANSVCHVASRYAKSKEDFYKVLNLLAKPEDEADYIDLHYAVCMGGYWNNMWSEIPELEQFIKNIKEA